MNKSFFKVLTAGALLAGLWSCNKDSQTPAPGNGGGDKSEVENLVIPASFDFSTVRQFKFKLNAIAPDGRVLRATKVQVLDGNPYTSATKPRVLAAGMIDAAGNFEGEITVPTALEKLYIRPNYAGLVDLLEVPNNGQDFVKNLVVTPGYTGAWNGEVTNSGGRTGSVASTSLTYMGGYNSQGVPNYLIANDAIDPQMLADINAALPEQVNINTTHPEFIDYTSQTNLVIAVDSTDVWMTFVHEGAGFKNALGYFTFPTGSTPTNKNQINPHTIAFPNSSYAGSGGGMVAGNKIYLGKFNAGTTIGFFLVSNGWNGVAVNGNNDVLYSIPQLNPEPNPLDRAHMVFLQRNNKFILGFEDNRLNYPGTDKDYNDVVYYATVVSPSKVNKDRVHPLPGDDDEDGDGVPDGTDEFPTDPDRAYVCECACGGKYGTLAYEDLWPSKGDYDFNDVVMLYNYKTILHANGRVKDLIGKFQLNATGAAYHNGFGFQLNNSSLSVQSVTSSAPNSVRFSKNQVQIAANGTEQNQTKATIIVTDDVWKMISSVAPGPFVNTVQSAGRSSRDTIRIKVTFANGLLPLRSALGADPYNPFIFRYNPADMYRRYEVHLANNPPTNNQATGLFGTKDDNSIPAMLRYYRTVNNMPFAIHIPAVFMYPTEKTQITKAYNFFGAWAESGGFSNSDWYENEPGYRNANNIFNY